MTKITEERFNKLWDEVAEAARADGKLSISDWSAMCREIYAYSKANGIKPAPDNSPFRHPAHLAFVAGAQWAFSLLNVVMSEPLASSSKPESPAKS